MSHENGETAPRRIEKAVSVVLRAGVVVSAAIICIGLALLAANGHLKGGTRIDAAMPFPHDLGGLLSGLATLDPASVLMLGLATLIATPFARVAVSIIAFALERDWHYVVITTLVFAVLVMGLIIGKNLD